MSTKRKDISMKQDRIGRREILGIAGGTTVGWVLGCNGDHADAAEKDPRALLGGFTWFKQSGFRVQDGNKVIYFDPYQISITPNDADVIFITHSHSDHCDPASVRKILKDGSKILTEPESANTLKSVSANITVVKPGDELTVDGFKVKVVPSYNINKSNHPKSKNYLGFVVTLSDGRRVYQAGDTDNIPEMADIQTDIALLPIGGTYTMTASEAAEAAKVIRPKVAVPMHYGAVVGSVRDAEQFQQLLVGVVEVVILKNNETVPFASGAVSGWKHQ